MGIIFGKTVYMNTFIKLIFLLTVYQSFGQNDGMMPNNNIRDLYFNGNPSLISKLKKQTGSNEYLFLFAEKSNDSIFTLFVLNNSKATIDIPVVADKIYILQEAIDSEGKWKPIEYFNYRFCGNAYRIEKFKSGNVIKTESTAYKGNFNTKIRFKLLVKDKIYYSNSLPGNIPLSQFMFSETAKQKSGFKTSSYQTNEKLTMNLLFLEPNCMSEFNTELHRKVKLKKKINTPPNSQ